MSVKTEIYVERTLREYSTEGDLFVQDAAGDARSFSFLPGFLSEFLEGVGIVLLFPGALSKLARPVADVGALLLLQCRCKVYWISKADKSISTRLARPIASHNLGFVE